MHVRLHDSWPIQSSDSHITDGVTPSIVVTPETSSTLGTLSSPGQLLWFLRIRSECDALRSSFRDDADVVGLDGRVERKCAAGGFLAIDAVARVAEQRRREESVPNVGAVAAACDSWKWSSWHSAGRARGDICTGAQLDRLGRIAVVLSVKWLSRRTVSSKEPIEFFSW